VNVPEDLHYADNHEWARREPDGLVRIGISDFAQDALGDVVFAELPEPGRQLAAGEAFGEVESTKSVSDVYAPVAGTVEAVNEALADTPDLVNSDPYGDGWFIVVRPDDESAVDSLMDAEAYTAFITPDTPD
jgi:glycine cleavage system H protein